MPRAPEQPEVGACRECGYPAVLHTNGHWTCSNCHTYLADEDAAAASRARRKHARTAVPINRIIRELVELRDELAP